MARTTATTLSPHGPNSSLQMRPVVTLAMTVLAHPDATRVGARYRFPLGVTEISRTGPDFVGVSGDTRPLEDLFVSRSPVRLCAESSGAMVVDRAGSRTDMHINSKELAERAELDATETMKGFALMLAKRVVLWIHRVGVEPERTADLGLVGRSEGIARVRRDVLQVADLDVPVLIRGETGTGKELVARAIHQASRRRSRPCEVLNMAAVPATLAASELFGHRKGAFSGADRKREGAFQRANGGTLFLDEIGDAPSEVQPLLLRALESGEIQPVGADGVENVDVRVIAATDSNLESSAFRRPLLHRLATYQVHLPPLRDRREDIGLLFYHFVEDALRTVGEADRLHADPAHPWVPASLLVALARAPWSGNVRQLRNVAQQLVIANRGQPRMQYRDLIERVLLEKPSLPAGPTAYAPAASAAGTAPPKEKDKAGYRKPSDVGDEELLAALRANGFRLIPTAKALNVSRTTLYALVEASPSIRKGSDLSREEIEEALRAGGRDLERAAGLLEVSEHALKLRMGALGLSYS